MDAPFNGKIPLKLCTESLAHKSDFLAEAVNKSNSKKIEFSSISHLNPVDFLPCSAQPSQAATGGSQISWAEISSIITALLNHPPIHTPTNPHTHQPTRG